VAAVNDFENVSFSLLKLEALKDSSLALIMSALTFEGDAHSTPKLCELQPSLDQVTVLVYSESSGLRGSSFIGHEMLFSAVGGVAGVVPVHSSSLGVADYQSASTTSYGPSHFGPSFPPSLAWLASLLRISKFSSKTSSFMAWSIVAYLSEGIPILNGITTSVPYMRENGVCPLLVLIVVAVGSFDLSIGLWMLDGCKSLFDVQLFAPVFEWIITELLSVVGFDFPWKTKSTYNSMATIRNFTFPCASRNGPEMSIPYLLNGHGEDPLWISLITYSACRGHTHRNHGLRNDLRYKTPSIKAYCLDFILTLCAFFVYAGSVPFVRYSSNGVVQQYPSSSTMAKTSLSSIDFSFSTSTKTCLVRMSPAPDPSRHEATSVNKVHGSVTASSTCISMSGPSSPGLSAMKSART
ncbi:hypothetical protein Tco_0366936, partial [Tanacetum coccineum]